MNSLSLDLNPAPLASSEPVFETCVSFHRIIALERKRTERSKKPFVLVLLDMGNGAQCDTSVKVPGRILSGLSASIRANDVVGWYEDQRVVGVMFTEIDTDDRGTILVTMMNRISATLQNALTAEKFSQISISLHVFPEDWNRESTHGNPTLYPDLANRDHKQKTHRTAKRVVDVIGSAVALVLFAPVFVIVGALVKLSSKGPILFRQERLGQFGRPFTFLKFRSMYVNNDDKVHQEFMKRVIGGEHKGEGDEEGEGKVVYKMTNDPRITPIGKFLRRTSLDELPQFISVLKGDMSLVGPRPPLSYECEQYDFWHRRRVLEVMPGITGLWQVRGRSRVRFDDMVRLDLQYIRTWSLWLDLQILMQTPKAILFGEDAF